MSERLSLPTQSWRPQRRESILDLQVRRMALIALGAAGLMGLGVAGYSTLANRPHGVPVIEADSRPLRVRPDNPGGLQVAGAEEQIMGGSGTGKADVMAPVAESPQPQVLRAQIQAARQPAPVAAPPVQPVVLAPPVAPAAAPSRPAAPPPPVAGGTEVQLAAMESEQAAMDEWRRLAKRMPDLLASRRPAVTKIERGGKALYRLRTGGFGDIAQATAFCTQVKAKGGGCSIASF